MTEHTDAVLAQLAEQNDHLRKIAGNVQWMGATLGVLVALAVLFALVVLLPQLIAAA